MTSRLLVAALFLSTAAFAGDPETHARLARDLAVVSMPEETWNKLVDGMAEDIARQFANKPNAPSKESFRDGMLEFISYKEIIDLQTAMLVKHYTIDEVRELALFYKTPLGQKVLKVTPEVTRDVNAELQLRIHKGMPKLIERFRAEQELKAQPQPKATPKKR